MSRGMGSWDVLLCAAGGEGGLGAPASFRTQQEGGHQQVWGWWLAGEGSGGCQQGQSLRIHSEAQCLSLLSACGVGGPCSPLLVGPSATTLWLSHQRGTWGAEYEWWDGTGRDVVQLGPVPWWGLFLAVFARPIQNRSPAGTAQWFLLCPA